MGRAKYLQLFHQSFFIWIQFCVADRIFWNELVFFEIMNKFLFFFQQGMQCLERSVALWACLANNIFGLFMGLT